MYTKVLIRIDGTLQDGRCHGCPVRVVARFLHQTHSSCACVSQLLELAESKLARTSVLIEPSAGWQVLTATRGKCRLCG